jgi:hypothetical protein
MMTYQLQKIEYAQKLQVDVVLISLIVLHIVRNSTKMYLRHFVRPSIYAYVISKEIMIYKNAPLRWEHALNLMNARIVVAMQGVNICMVTIAVEIV